MNFFLLTSFLCTSFLAAQNSILKPPANITKAFELQYPEKKPIWTLEYNKDYIKFIANFTQSANIKSCAIYDDKGVFRAYKVQILMEKLPQNVKKYLTKEYPMSVKQVFSVVDEKKNETYEVGTVKGRKNYTIVFDKNGNCKSRTQIE
jgi:hypothetical protein